MNDTIIVVDYGMGNIKSIQRGLEQVGAKAKLSSSPSEIATASHLILPGVGAFAAGMNGLRSVGLIDAINDFVKTGNPLLGICLGMQMLLDESKEHGVHKGLGLIAGSVKKIPEGNGGGPSRKVPHIGWIDLKSPYDQSWSGSCLEDTKVGEFFYFVHSYMVVPEKEEAILAQCEDDGLFITAAIKRDNITGLQFHPEKSGETGLKILKSFVNN